VPFRGSGPGDIFDSILHKAQTAPVRMNPEVPVDLERIIQKALEKDRDLRYQHASEMRSDLKRLKRETESGRVVAEDASAGSPALVQPLTPAPGVASASSSSILMAEAPRNKSKLIGAAAVVLLALTVAAAFGVYKFLTRTPAVDIRNLNIRPLTDHGEVVGFPGISPDGRLIAYARREGERSLRVKQVITGSEVIVAPPQAGYFSSATFTPDGNYLYYLHTDPANQDNWNIYAVPALGGASRKIVSDVVSAVAFSPDGKRIVYRRTIEDKGEDQVVIANADGTGEQVIFRHESGANGLTTNPSWSNSRNLIAVAIGEVGKKSLASILVLNPGGKLVNSFPVPMFVSGLEWLPDSSGLFLIGAEKSTGGRWQIWFQSYPAGELSKVSNDLSQYASLSVTADGKSFVTAQQRRAAAIYVGDSPSVLNDKIDWKLTPISNEQATGYEISWTAAGNLLQQDAESHIYVTAADGSARVRLLENDELPVTPIACGPGDVVIVTRVLESNTPDLWRLNVATGELKQLTFGKIELQPSCTPDGKWVVYSGYLATDRVVHIFKISTDGGAPLELALGQVFYPVVSPDGKFVAYGKSEGQGANLKTKFVVQRLEGGPPLQEIEAPDRWDRLGWTPDGRALTYIRNTTGSITQNVYMQLLAGGVPVQLTHFNSEPGTVLAYAWSRNGKKFAITRARYNDTDVVMFSGFR
jgi:Tol biopolymer transport system component